MLFFAKSFWMDILINDSLGIELVPFVMKKFHEGKFEGRDQLSASNGELLMEAIIDGKDITFISGKRLDKWMTHSQARDNDIYWHHTPTELWMNKMFIQDLHREKFPLGAIEAAYFETRSKDINKVHVVINQGARIAAKKRNRTIVELLNGSHIEEDLSTY